ncbi:MAG: hypothetical protein SOT28_10790 [Fusicatenibacter sp.]|nr:hypothetical protein [Lachnospiraceae bacterium]MDY2938776.1 hypothetical protein [Fusicatenibacter sp.]
MNNALPRTVIETIVRKAITDIQDAPKRSTRNLIDMALTVAEGRFQSRFFQTAQTMLKNENSSYYKLIPDVAASVDTDKIVTFGLNLGYNSCTVGAKRIRDFEKREHFNIPWSITLAISGKDYMGKEESYRSVLNQGKALGIYTWMIYALDGVDHILSLAAHEPECAFVIYCDPEEITEVMLDEAENINDIMFAVRQTDGVEEACRLLRSRHFLYSVFYTYHDSDLNSIISGEHLSNIEFLHPVFTAFLAEPDCTEKTQKAVYQYVTEMRKSQKYPTVLWDAVYDSRFVDSIISEDSCSAGFDTQGYLCTFQGQLQRLEYNIFRQPLETILKQAFSKSVIPISLASA